MFHFVADTSSSSEHEVLRASPPHRHNVEEVEVVPHPYNLRPRQPSLVVVEPPQPPERQRPRRKLILRFDVSCNKYMHLFCFQLLSMVQPSHQEAALGPQVSQGKEVSFSQCLKCLVIMYVFMFPGTEQRLSSSSSESTQQCVSSSSSSSEGPIPSGTVRRRRRKLTPKVCGV